MWMIPLPYKLGIAGLLAAVLIGLGWSWMARHDEQVRALCTQRYTDAEVLDLKSRLERSENARESLATEMDTLRRQRIDLPTVPVRLCRYTIAAGNPVRGAQETEPSRAGALPQAGPPTVTAGPDIGPGLDRLWDEADEIVAKCRAEGH
jgi:hypothetical protein